MTRVRWDSLPPGVTIAAEWGGRKSPAAQLVEQRKRNRTDKVRQGTVAGTTIVVDALVPTVNELLGMHHMKRVPVTKMWRDLGATIGLSTPAIVGRVNVEVWPTAGPRGGIGDTACRVLAVKAIVDGLVDAGVLAEDDTRFIGWERHHPAVRGDRAELRIEIVPIDLT